LVKQHYSSVNPMDEKVRKFNYFKLPLPATLGWDVAGVVTEVGEGVTKFSVGDEVFGFATMAGGGFAQYVLANERSVVKRVNLPADVAGGSSIVWGTAWNPLYIVDDLNKRKGQTIFIPGGGGGIGHVAIQLAKKSGLRVIASASKPESIQLAKQCGADDVIDYSKSDDVVEEVLKLTNNREGVDLAFDSTYAGSSFVQSARVVKKGGRWIRVGGPAWNAGGVNDEEAREVCKERGVEATNGDLGRYWLPDFSSRLHEVAEMLEACDRLYASGVSVKVAKVVPFDIESVRQAEEASSQGKIFGKFVIKVGNK